MVVTNLSWGELYMDLRKRVIRGAEAVTRGVGAQGIPDYFGGRTGKMGLAKGVVGLAGTIGSIAVGGGALRGVGQVAKAAYNVRKYGAPRVKFTGTNPNSLSSQNYVDKLSKAMKRRKK